MEEERGRDCCARCGAPSPAGSKFCGSCGTALGGSGRPLTPPPYVGVVVPAPAGRRRRRALFVVPLALALVAASVMGAWALGSGSPPVETPVVAAMVSEPRPEPVDEVDDEPDEPVEYTDAELAAEFGTAIHRVEVDGCGFVGNGTAFAIDEHHLVTNWHVVDIDTSPTLRSRSGDERQGTVVGAVRQPDLAIIHVDEPLSSTLDWAATDDLAEGQHLLGMGYPVPGTEFAVAPGTILSFEGPAGDRRWVRTDAAVDRGSSGGPALTSEGTVAGVVTEMAENTDGFQNVALLLPFDAAEPVVDGILAGAHEFAVDCDEPAVAAPRPDRAPIEVPERPELPAAPPPPRSEMPTTAPPAPCPSGQVVVEVTSVRVSDDFGLGIADVRVEGVIRNQTGAAIFGPMIDVHVDGDDIGSFAMADQMTIPAGGTSNWNTSTMLFDPPRGQPGARASVSDWMWEDVNLLHCPTG